jgi:hypothetical protein
MPLSMQLDANLPSITTPGNGPNAQVFSPLGNPLVSHVMHDDSAREEFTTRLTALIIPRQIGQPALNISTLCLPTLSLE